MPTRISLPSRYVVVVCLVFSRQANFDHQVNVSSAHGPVRHFNLVHARFKANFGLFPFCLLLFLFDSFGSIIIFPTQGKVNAVEVVIERLLIFPIFQEYFILVQALIS